MPRLSDSMEEGTVLQWLKQVGDEIAVGDELVEIETDKANMAYEADVAGTLTEILVQEGETVPIGTPIARVGDAGETVSPQAQEEPAPAPPRQTTTAAPPRPFATEEEDGHRPKASPLARRIAKERELDLTQLEGSGPGGRIVKADVERASSAGDGGDGGVEDDVARSAPPPPPSGPAAEGISPETAKGQVSYEDLSKLQSTIARRMSESKATAPHFYLRASVDMSRAVEGRALVKAGAAEGDIVPSFNDMVVKACALALREHPRANGAYRDGRFELYSRVNVGVAVAARDALVVPTVFDADRKGLRQIASESRTLAGKVREGQITPPELSGATFTVSNLGMYGIDGFSAVINPPQAAILAVGAIVERPVVRDGEIATAHLMQVDLACDHRILYGAPAAEFLARIQALLEEPLSLAL
ncbi:MAG TPA: dihydrolipoamide acetyltransferase family protein [Solirubrobacterales bacterium]|nr:dihydrolipoamide acetyltransferase family protein [Solirubrobacterales bacterium]